jgi:hypothetical protein
MAVTLLILSASFSTFARRDFFGACSTCVYPARPVCIGRCRCTVHVGAVKDSQIAKW